ncbi:hypothetical protein BJ912DRAFT_986999 [Pholiota molesta]|nr:hypothetical protein BJ912DRAFT_986999 [Pholiota molesta]
MRYGERVSPVVNTHHPPSADSPSSVDNHLERVVSMSLLVTAAVLLLTAAHTAQKPFRRRRLCAIRRRRAIALLDQRTSMLENTRRVGQGNDRSVLTHIPGQHARTPSSHPFHRRRGLVMSLAVVVVVRVGAWNGWAVCASLLPSHSRRRSRPRTRRRRPSAHSHRRCTYCFLACAALAQISVLVLVPHLGGCPSLTLLVYCPCRSRCSSVVAAPPVCFCVHAGEGRRLSVLRGSCALWCPWTTIRTI